jgi:predicted DNA-binding protein
MKKIILILFTLLIFQYPSFSEKNQNEVLKNGIVNFYSGQVSIVRNGKASAPKIGATVSQGMKIETGVNSFIEICFGNNIVKVMEKTSVTITKLMYDIKKSGHATEFYIARGRVFSHVAEKLSKNDRYIVKTVTTTAAVRGTEFLVSEDEGKGAVSCLNGKIEVSKAGDASLNPVMLEGGKVVEFAREKRMFVHSLSQKNLSELKGISENIKGISDDIKKKVADERTRITEAVQLKREKMKNIIDGQNQKSRDESGRVKEAVEKKIKEMDDMKNLHDGAKQKVNDAAEKAKDEVRKITD